MTHIPSGMDGYVKDAKSGAIHPATSPCLNFPKFHEQVARLNRIARMGCDSEQVFRVASKIWLDAVKRNVVDSLNMEGR